MDLREIKEVETSRFHNNIGQGQAEFQADC